ncbi:ASCH domain-containing protein [Lyngbya sp. CCY1209]|uniref:ASCH domain-containing protein n=1 Tax=Lyngbya sp. CCY1209 TaxID=2886103 RepID=UPI002D203C4B|nr:ASCH domain-containing protein [Lyngbya sp. CCY1209]MEB3885519.1 ASCH domain-containing protein [Lyngbya sp. CCY1209]
MIQTSLLPLIDELLLGVQGDNFWENYLKQLMSQDAVPFSLHLAIFVEPYLQFVLEGKKTVESRFSTRRFAPYNKVQKGDVVLLKRSSGPILGICQISYVWFYELDPQSWHTIRQEFSQALCAQDPEFWKAREAASYATLMRVNNVKAIEPIKFTKRDRRGWVVLHKSSGQLELNLKEVWNQ